MNIAIQLISAFFGSMGFSLCFRLRKKLLIKASLGGMICWAIYLVLEHYTDNIFISCLAASAFASLYAELLARLLKVPAKLFIIPAVVPLIPGGSLYYTMSNFVAGNREAATSYGNNTLLFAVAIAGGISIVWAYWKMVHNFRKRSRIG